MTNDATPGNVPLSDQLGPLPEPLAVVRDTNEEPDGGGWIVDCDCEGPLSYSLSAHEALYTGGQMREYARQHVYLCDEKLRAEIEAGEAALDVAAAEVARLRGIVDAARQAIAARDRFGWSPEADAAIGRLRGMVGPR